jgi:hypothetical protein
MLRNVVRGRKGVFWGVVRTSEGGGLRESRVVFQSHFTTLISAIANFQIPLSLW